MSEYALDASLEVIRGDLRLGRHRGNSSKKGAKSLLIRPRELGRRDEFP